MIHTPFTVTMLSSVEQEPQTRLIRRQQSTLLLHAGGTSEDSGLADI